MSLTRVIVCRGNESDPIIPLKNHSTDDTIGSNQAKKRSIDLEKPRLDGDETLNKERKRVSKYHSKLAAKASKSNSEHSEGEVKTPMQTRSAN